MGKDPNLISALSGMQSRHRKTRADRHQRLQVWKHGTPELEENAALRLFHIQGLPTIVGLAIKHGTLGPRLQQNSTATANNQAPSLCI
jgi:hypothetical protein